MDTIQGQQQIFILVTTVFILILLMLMINLLLAGRNKRLRHEAEIIKINAKLDHEVANAKMEVTEATINQVAMDLHDDVGQMITFSIMQLNALQKKFPSELSNEIEGPKESVRQALNSIRNIAKTMSTDYVSNFGIKAALRNFAEKINKANGPNIELNIKDTLHFFSPSNELFCYRIIQECVSNTIKYAGAKQIKIDVFEEKGTIKLIYFDDGKGLDFDPNANPKKTGIGHISIKNRVALMNGELKFLKFEPNGMGIEIVFPNK